tara:strand:+ start:7103 stop:7516 length:414 start_codon:yes stop_codon:yes gene_type:complete
MGSVNNLCAPALIYLVFSLTHIIIDIFKEQYNQSFFKFIVMIFFTILLHLLCRRGLGVISWMIVFIPFISLSFLTAILLFVFGLNPSSGRIRQIDTRPSRRDINRAIRKDRRFRNEVRNMESNPNSYRELESLTETD